MRTAPDGRPYFVDYNIQKTTWDDPRIQKPDSTDPSSQAQPDTGTKQRRSSSVRSNAALATALAPVSGLWMYIASEKSRA
ncbi:hypothetical protein CPB86DRAFT_872624 [Serendipita vermifera]|nr:hypothetical protein CPB86DRAFT_872624 [Serendipita vermifera]